MDALLLKGSDVTVALGVSRVTLWRLVKHGDFPQPLRIGRNILRWRRADVDAWLETRRAVSA